MKAKATGFTVGGGVRRFATLEAARAAADKVFATTGVVVAIESYAMFAAKIGESMEKMVGVKHFGPGDYVRLGDRLVSWEFLMST